MTTALGLLLGLDAVPQIRGHELFTPRRILEHMRMPADHLSRDRVNHVGKLEPRLF